MSDKYIEIERELVEKFVSKKKVSLLLSDSYRRIGEIAKSHYVADCGTSLQYAKEISVDGEFGDKPYLHRANFCKDRLCPMCSWRRSLKIFGQVSQIMDYLAKDYRFLFLTLTVPNVSGYQLHQKIEEMNRAWKKLRQRKVFQENIGGYFKALEVTRNESTGEYHPHFHVVLAVRPNYFYDSKKYISRDKWLVMWQKSMKDDSITQVDVRVVKNKSGEVAKSVDELKSIVAEIAKYSVKSSDYIIQGNEQLTDRIVFELSTALDSHIRLCSTGGVFYNTQTHLDLDDMEDGDLVHVEGCKINPELSWLILNYGWSAGCYKLVSSEILTPEQRKQKYGKFINSHIPKHVWRDKKNPFKGLGHYVTDVQHDWDFGYDDI